MREARRTAVWLAILVGIVFGGDRLLSAILDQVLLRSQFRFSRVYGGRSEADILTLGDSRGVNSFYAPAIENLTGKRVLNLSYNSMTPRIAEAIFADYLERNRPPELVVIEATHLIADSNLETELRTYANHSPRLRALYAERHPRAARVGGWFRLLAFNSEFFFRALYYLRRSDQVSILRSTISPELLATPPSGWPLVPMPGNLEALERLVRSLRARGVTVRLVIAPYQSPDVVNLPEFSRLVRDRAGVPVLNYIDAGGPPENFADRVHMNERGAVLFCQRLAADGVFRR